MKYTHPCLCHTLGKCRACWLSVLLPEGVSFACQSCVRCASSLEGALRWGMLAFSSHQHPGWGEPGGQAHRCRSKVSARAHAGFMVWGCAQELGVPVMEIFVRRDSEGRLVRQACVLKQDRGGGAGAGSNALLGALSAGGCVAWGVDEFLALASAVAAPAGALPDRQRGSRLWLWLWLWLLSRQRAGPVPLDASASAALVARALVDGP